MDNESSLDILLSPSSPKRREREGWFNVRPSLGCTLSISKYLWLQTRCKRDLARKLQLHWHRLHMVTCFLSVQSDNALTFWLLVEAMLCFREVFQGGHAASWAGRRTTSTRENLETALD